MGPRKNAPKIAHFTRSNGFVPTKHPNSRTPSALKGIRGLAFGGLVGTQAFQEVSDGLGEAADAHDALSSSVPKGFPSSKTRVYSVF